MKIRDTHPLTNKRVLLKTNDELDGKVFMVEDWCENLIGCSWQDGEHIVCLNYFSRTIGEGSKHDDEVVGGKIGQFSFLVHQSEIGDEVESFSSLIKEIRKRATDPITLKVVDFYIDNPDVNPQSKKEIIERLNISKLDYFRAERDILEILKKIVAEL